MIGLCWDLLRAVRRLLPKNALITAALDLMFLCGYGAFLPVFAAAEARGCIRGYFVLGNIIGALLYLMTVSRPVNAVLKWAAGLLKRIFMIVMRPFVSGYVLLCKKVEPKFVGISKVIVKYIKKMSLLLHTLPRSLYNKRANIKGKNVELIGEKDQRQKEEKGSVQRRTRKARRHRRNGRLHLPYLHNE
ncbi:MAG: spore cortex biosynthesis protein YabQ [Ruminococcus sp.]|nr:spore cortex biosynthesis protein YabQ [Ruminococcus sp.]